MDSLTQIVLGAACGEAALGKKIGNKALLFGAIGGTIPDLDVFVGRWLFNNEIDSMAFHRGFMHSIVFAILAALALGYLVHWLYNNGKRKGSTTRKDWIWLFFLSIFTHPFLDSLTPYGTQLFLPFSDYRVAVNNIAVVDPIYTLPFLLCLIVVMFFRRTSNKRWLWTKIGILISSFYLILTLINKVYINNTFEKSLNKNKIDYTRFQTQPSIFNNVLWYGIAENDNNYHVAFYSILDESSQFSDWQELPKNHELVPVDHPDIQTLSWFSNGYYNVTPLDSVGQYRYNDLRYPLFDTEDPNSSVFSFTIYQDEDRWNILPFQGRPPSSEDLIVFWERIKGKP